MMKKVLTWILMLGLWLTSSLPTGAFAPPLCGDADVNGTIDTKDVRLYLKGVLSDEPSDNIADLNGDGVIDTVDIRIVLDDLLSADAPTERLLTFETPKNTSLSHDEIEAARAAQIVNTYEEFEEVCAMIRYAFYTPYETENGSFDAWAKTITPDYFTDKSLFILTHGTAASRFELAYSVSTDTVDLTIKQSGRNAFCRFNCHQLIVELDKADLVDRETVFHLINE